MKRIIVAGVSVLVLGACGAVTGAWWWQADMLQKQIEQWALPPFVTFEKQSIAKTGFPFMPGVRIAHPRLIASTGPMGATIEQDAMQLSKSLLANRYSVQYGKSGSLNITSPAKQWNVDFQSQAASTLDLEFDGPWNFILQPQASDPKAWLSRLHHVQWHSAPAEWKDKSGALLLSTGKSRLTGDIEHPADQPARHAWHISAENMKYTAAYDTMMQEMTGLLTGLPMQSNLVHYGAISIEYGLRFALPQQGMTNPFQALDFALEPGKFTSDLGKVDFNLAFQQTPDATGALEGKAHFDLTGITQPKADQVLAQGLLHMLRNPQIAQNFPSIAQKTDAELWPLVAEVTPRYSTLGSITQGMEVHYRIEPAKGAHQVELIRFGVNAAPYGITAQGTETTNPPAGRTLDASMDCRGCETLFNDLSAYFARLQHALRELAPNGSSDPMISLLGSDLPAQQIAMVKAMLQQLAVIGTDGVWHYRLQQSGGGVPTINDKPLPALGGPALPGIAPAQPAP